MSSSGSGGVAAPVDVRRERATTVGLYGGLVAVSTFLGIWAIGLLSWPWDVPLFYKSDALAGGAQAKTTLETGWYEFNPMLAAPQGQSLHELPIADNLPFVVIRVLGLVVDDWATVNNLAYVLTFPLAAVAGAWFLRLIGVSRTGAFAFGLLFAFAPYHFMHGVAHLTLSMYFVVPLGAGLAYVAITRRSLWGRRAAGSRWNPLTWATTTTAGTLVILLLVGSTSAYYAVFTLIFLTVAVVALLVQRQVRRALGAVMVIVGLISVMVINMLPDVVYQWRHPGGVISFARQEPESELYALKFSSLILPTLWNRIDGLAAWRLGTYDTVFPLPGERPALGVVAAVGFLFLLLLPVFTLVRHQFSGVPGTTSRGVADESRWVTQRVLAVFTFVAFFFGTVGGFATLFAILVSPSIRAWNRISICLTLFALAAVALLVDRFVGAWLRPRLERRDLLPARLRAVPALGIAAILLAVGLVDQVPPSGFALTGDEQEQWANDEAYAAAVEELVPADGMVIELPFLGYPEAGALYDMGDYDPIRPYLHTSDVRWTYGGVNGLPRSSWTQRLSTQPVGDLLVQAVASGAEGIHVDRYGFPDRDSSSLEKGFAARLGDPVVSPNERFAFYDLTEHAERVRRRVSTTDLAVIRRRTLLSPEVFWHDFQPPYPEGEATVLRSTTPEPVLQIGNPGREVPVEVTFTLRADGSTGPVQVDLTWPDGEYEQLDVPDAGLEVSRSFDLPPGTSELSLGTADADSLSLLDLTVEDPVLDSALARIQ